MELLQDFKRMALCFVIMIATVGVFAWSANAHDTHWMQHHSASSELPRYNIAIHHQRHTEHPTPLVSVVVHRAVAVVSYVAGFVD